MTKASGRSRHGLECTIELPRRPHFGRGNPNSQEAPRRVHLLVRGRVERIGGIGPEAPPGIARNDLGQQLQSLAFQIRRDRHEPVTLPPGRARLATRPVPTGSPTATMTSGMGVVPRWTARAAGVPAVA